MIALNSRKSMNKSTKRQPVIALCKMFSGDYWKYPNNIGYESLNMFLPDGQKAEEKPVSYIYLPPYGDYNFNKNEIRYVLLIQHIAKNVKKKASIVKIIGIAEVKEETLKKNHDACNKSEKYTCVKSLSKLQDVFLKHEKRETLSEEEKKLYSKAKQLKSIHDKQLQKLANVKYCGKKVEDIFKNNNSIEKLTIFTSLTVQNLRYPKKNIYLTNSIDAFSNDNTNGDTIFEVGKNPTAQKQTIYIDYKKEFIDDIEKCGLDDANELDINSANNAQYSFLAIIKKEYDELVYSNLFAHFFGIKNFFEHFFKEFLKKNITIKNKLEVVREENNIDILIKADDYVIVIENKIKSALNGHPEEDINGEIFKNQLVKYYQYVEEKYSDKTRCYFLFAPNYNHVDEENLGKTNGVEMKDKWKVIRYDKILQIFDGYRRFTGTPDELYYEEFKKALEIHTVDSYKNYYRDMLIRLKNLP